MSFWTDLFGSKSKAQTISAQTTDTAQTQNQQQSQNQVSSTQSATQQNTSQTQNQAQTQQQNQQTQTGQKTQQSTQQTQDQQSQTQQTQNQSGESLVNTLEQVLNTAAGKSTQATSGETAQATQQTGNTQVSSVVSKLDPETLAMLKAMLPGLAATASANPGEDANVQALQTLGGALTAMGTDTEGLDKLIKSQQSEATRVFQNTEGADIQREQSQIGSRMNTFSDLVKQKGDIDLATAMGNVAANTTMQFRQQMSANLSAAVEAVKAASGASLAEKQAAVTNLVGVINQISGANITTSESQINQQTGTTTGTSKQQQAGETSQTTQGQTSQSQAGKTSQQNVGTTTTSAQDVLSALTNGQTDTNSVMSALDELFGTTSTTGQTAQTSNTEQALQALSELTGTATQHNEVAGKTSGTQTNNPGIISSIVSLF